MSDIPHSLREASIDQAYRLKKKGPWRSAPVFNVRQKVRIYYDAYSRYFNAKHHRATGSLVPV
ncbi:MAG: hypothetical protein ACI9NT_001460, partial [Bacteroidia bacterium]